MASIINVEQIGSQDGNISLTPGINLDLHKTPSHILLPSGTLSERNPSPSEGAFRWNSEFNQFEIFDGTKWRFGRFTTDKNFLEGIPVLSLDTSDSTESYPGFGSKWYNNSFFPYTATLYGSPTFNPSNSGFFEFDGTTNYGTLNIDDQLKPSSSITQECWFKLNSTSNYPVLIGLQYGISSNNSYALYFTSSTWAALVNQSGTSVSISHSKSTTPLVADQWYHFVHTYSDSAFTIQRKATSQAGSNILDILSEEFDFISGMTISGTGIPNDPLADPIIETTITSVDFQNKRITLSNAITESATDFTINCSLPSSQILYINGNIAETLTMDPAETIAYTEENTTLTIGGDFNGPGVSAGIGGILDGGISFVRIYATNLTPSQIRNNFDVIKVRYGY